MPEIIPYEIGKFYRVPCVAGTLAGVYSWWPVLGPWHEDADFVGFAHHHYHVDARFLNARQWAHIEAMSTKRYNAVFADVIYTDSDVPRELRQVVGPPQLRRRKCRRQYPEYPSRITRWLPKLNAAFADAKIDDRLKCPHRGASLQGLSPDSEGCVTCPLHGLRWDCQTGKLKPATRERL